MIHIRIVHLDWRLMMMHVPSTIQTSYHHSSFDQFASENIHFMIDNKKPKENINNAHLVSIRLYVVFYHMKFIYNMYSIYISSSVADS